MLDVDKFKSINDTFGHHAGDAVLQTTAQRLVETVRASDTVIRLGGDEFLVLLATLPGPQVAESVAAIIVSALSIPVRCENINVPVSVSVGVCTHFSGERLAVEVLLRRADIALYQAKAQGRHCFHVFTGELEGSENELQRAAAIAESGPSSGKCA
jgi:two-component system CheB/CheR fusion protein